MNKQFTILILEVYAMIFGGIALLITFLNLVVMKLYSLIIPCAILSVIVFSYLWIRYNELANSKYLKPTRKRFILAIVSLLIVLFLFWQSFQVPLDKAMVLFWQSFQVPLDKAMDKIQ